MPTYDLLDRCGRQRHGGRVGDRERGEWDGARVLAAVRDWRTMPKDYGLLFEQSHG